MQNIQIYKTTAPKSPLNLYNTTATFMQWWSDGYLVTFILWQFVNKHKYSNTSTSVTGNRLGYTTLTGRVALPIPRTLV